MVDFALVGRKSIRNGAYRSAIADVIYQAINQLMKKRFVPETVFCHDIPYNESVQHFTVDADLGIPHGSEQAERPSHIDKQGISE